MPKYDLAGIIRVIILYNEILKSPIYLLAENIQPTYNHIGNWVTPCFNETEVQCRIYNNPMVFFLS